MRIDVQIQGNHEVIKALHGMTIDVNHLDEAFGEIAKRAARYAISYAPKRTGRLAQSIKSKASRNKAVIRTGSLAYAGPIHWGWPARGIAASNFMLKAERAVMPMVQRRIEAELRQLIKRHGLI